MFFHVALSLFPPSGECRLHVAATFTQMERIGQVATRLFPPLPTRKENGADADLFQNAATPLSGTEGG